MIICAWRGRFLEWFDSPDVDLRLGRGQEQVRLGFRDGVVNQPFELRERFDAAFVVVRIKKTRILPEFVHGLADRLAGESVGVEKRAHLALDPRHFAQTEIVHFIWRHGCGRVFSKCSA